MTDKLLGPRECGPWARFSIFSVCFMAFCVSLGMSFLTIITPLWRVMAALLATQARHGDQRTRSELIA